MLGFASVHVDVVEHQRQLLVPPCKWFQHVDREWALLHNTDEEDGESVGMVAAGEVPAVVVTTAVVAKVVGGGGEGNLPGIHQEFTHDGGRGSPSREYAQNQSAPAPVEEPLEPVEEPFP